MTDEVSISLGGAGAQTILTGWQQVRITLGIERAPPDFEIVYSEPLPGKHVRGGRAWDVLRRVDWRRCRHFGIR
jgi:hypothetical protein